MRDLRFQGRACPPSRPAPRVLPLGLHFLSIHEESGPHHCEIPSHDSGALQTASSVSWLWGNFREACRLGEETGLICWPFTRMHTQIHSCQRGCVYV